MTNTTEEMCMIELGAHAATLRKMPVGIVIYDVKPSDTGREYSIYSVNEYFEKLVGKTKDLLVGEDVSGMFFPKENDEWTDTLEEAFTGARPSFAEIYLDPPTRKWVSITAFNVDPGHVAAIYRDITAEKRMESALELER